MNIVIISGSNRKNSQSIKVSEICKKVLNKLSASTSVIDLHKKPIPLWDELETKSDSHPFRNISKSLMKAMGFVFVVPEWGGMAPPQVKNLFLLSSNQELSHKPGLIITISASNGGSYPLAELRSYSYKNTRICWMPDHVIIRNVGEFKYEPGERVSERINYSCKMLIEYAKALKPIRKIANFKNFKNGM